MNKDEIRNLLLRIVNEPDYRALMIADPTQALAQYGMLLDPKLIPPNGVQLPSNADITNNIDQFTNTLEAAGISHVHALFSLSP